MNELLTTLLQNSVATCTDRNGIITFASEDFCQLCGYSREELLGQNHNIIRHPDTPAEYFEAMWKRILAGEVHKGVVKNRRKNGSAFWAQTTILPQFEGGQIVGFAAIRFDITALVLAQEQLLNQQRIIASQSRHAVLGQLISAIAHQWRQPLQELSLELFFLKGASASSYARSRNLIDKMSEMIEDLQRFGRPLEHVKQTTLRQIFKLALSLVRMSVRKNRMRLRFRGRFDYALCTDPAAIAQVVVNIIKNALEACSNVAQPELLITANKSADGYELGFFDNGPGLSDSEKVFEMYYSSKHPSDGVGLGLHICKQILNSLGGEMITAPSPLGGAGFRVFLRSNNGEDFDR